MSEPTAMIEELPETPDRLESLTRGASDAALDHAAEGEWSTRTVLAHLRDDEFMVTRLRLVRLLTVRVWLWASTLNWCSSGCPGRSGSGRGRSRRSGS